MDEGALNENSDDATVRRPICYEELVKRTGIVFFLAGEVTGTTNNGGWLEH